MSDPRIADVPSGAPAQLSQETPARWVTLLSTRLSSPIGVTVVIPVLVAVVGVFLTLVGQQALRDSSLEVAQARLSEQAQVVAVSVRDALSQADPLLSRVIDLARGHQPAGDLAPIAHRLADLMRGRPGVTYTSISFPDGTFHGVYVDDDGQLRAQQSRVQRDGTHVQRYDLADGDTLRPQREETSSYDPRQRAFYKLAVQTKGPAWTEPYPFFDSHQTGISRVAPVFVTDENGEARLHAVVTVDFDVHGLSSHVQHHQLPGSRSLLLSRDGTILAYTADGMSPSSLPRPSDRVLRRDDLHDPVIDGLFDALPNATTTVVEVAAERYLLAVAGVGDQQRLGLLMAWSVAYLAPESRFLASLHNHRQRSLGVGAFALVTAVVVALLFARSITRTRREAERARRDAAQARAQAKELGSYRLVACLGKGAMGEVWRAEHRLLARQAAIKLIHPQLRGRDTPEVRERFRREAQTLASLRSRHTIELYDYGIAADGTFFFVMELLDGMDLETLVERHGPQPAARVVQLLLQIGSSLAEAHDRGLVHRDIKPANIFVCCVADEVDVVKVLDFGLVLADPAAAASASDSALNNGPLPHTAAVGDAAALGADSADLHGGKLTQPGGLVGTPAFIPPEQAMGKVLDGRTDLYAMACVACWLLSARLVFAHDNPMQLLVAHMTEPVPDLSTILPADVPPALIALLTECLQKDPNQRPSDVRAFCERLRQITLAQSWTHEQAQAWWRTHRSMSDTGPDAGSDTGPDATPLSNAPTLLSVHRDDV